MVLGCRLLLLLLSLSREEAPFGEWERRVGCGFHWALQGCVLRCMSYPYLCGVSLDVCRWNASHIFGSYRTCLDRSKSVCGEMVVHCIRGVLVRYIFWLGALSSVPEPTVLRSIISHRALRPTASRIYRLCELRLSRMSLSSTRDR